MAKQIENIEQLQEHLSGYNYYIAITNGGLFATGLLSRFVKIRRVETFNCWSYNHEEEAQLDKHKFIPKEFNCIEGKKVLIVDDLVDTGDTIKFCKDHLSKFYPAQLDTFVWYKKESTKVEPDYYLKKMPGDVWIDFSYDFVEFDKIDQWLLKSNK